MAQLHPDTLLRQWQMLRMIPRHPHKITAKSLHEKLQANLLDVTKRTVERDLHSLSEMFPLVSDERDKPYGWSWKKDAPIFNLPGLSSHEALTLAMVEQHLNALLPASTLSQIQPYFEAAKQQLSNISHTEQVHSWLNKVRTVPTSQPLLPPTIKPDVQRNIYDALLADKQLAIKYQKLGKTNSADYCIHPLAVVQRGSVTYLCCRFAKYEDLRTLALHRIQSVTILDEATCVPADFSIDEQINIGKFGFGHGELIQLEAIFYSAMGNHMFETALSHDQTITKQENGSFRLTATVADTPQLVWWLLGLSDSVEVIKPEKLRLTMADTIAKMQKRYQPSATTANDQ